MNSNVYSTLSIISFQMLYIILALALFLMINSRLFQDLEEQISIREKTEKILRQSEEKFYKAFHASPDAIILASVDNGRIVEVNDGFCRMFEYARKEVLADNTLNLKIWANPQDRSAIIADLRNGRRIRNRECKFTCKSGMTRYGLLSAERIEVAQQPHLLSIIHDISGRKQADRIIHIRLELWEYARTHTLLELMRKALGEVQQLTGSETGFFHFIESTQQALEFRIWSANTDKTAYVPPADTRIPLPQRDAVAECVRTRRPVILNNSKSFPSHAGLPAGHSPLTRELIVPIINDNAVAAVLGVGDKPADYTDLDGSHALFIADIAWSVIEQKQAYEDIVKLNEKLERQAMTDVLTGLHNRRSFFIHGKKEILRARRYQTPLSLLMLDLDRFKNINDAFGHDAGDSMLQCFAKELQKNIRETDIPARLGGEEFSALLPNTDRASAFLLAERLRQAVEAMSCRVLDQDLYVTVSIGISELHPDMASLTALLKEADAALYEAKEQGRNRVISASGPEFA